MFKAKRGLRERIFSLSPVSLLNYFISMTLNPWTSEFEVNPDLAAHLIQTQFPELKPVRLQRCGSGWDNVVYAVNDRWYFRFPQRQMAAEGVRCETAALPILAEFLSEIPRIAFAGTGAQGYPWNFFGYAPLQGQEPAHLRLQNRVELAARVAKFLKKLHSPEVFLRLSETLSADPLGRLNFYKRVPMTEERLRNLQKLGMRLPQKDLQKILRASLGTSPLPCRAVVHGDLHFRHIITNPKGELKGVIDWGDLHLNDPAVDLQLYWSFFVGSERDIFLQNYGPVTDAQLVQARSFAVFLNIALLTAAVDQKQSLIAEEAMDSLQRILTEGPV